MSTIPDDLDAWEHDLRQQSGFQSPLDAATPPHSGGQPHSTAVVRTAVPIHEREPPADVTLTAPCRDHPVPRGTVITGPVTSREQADEHLTDGVGWLISVGPGGTREPVPVITGEYYDGSPQLAIIAEMMIPPPGSDLEDALGGSR